MSKKSKSKKNNQYPIEFPSHDGQGENSPVIDEVVKNETLGKNTHQSGAYNSNAEE